MAKTATGSALAVQQANAILKTSQAINRAKRSRRRPKKSFTIPIAIVAGFAPGILRFKAQGGFGSHTGGALKLAVSHYIPYDYMTQKITFAGLKWGMIPILVGILTHKYIGNKLGVNRALKQMGVPVIRL
jgi:hypothetical protein